MASHSQAGMFPLLLFIILGQPPVTTGKVAGPRMSSLVQRGPRRGRQQVLQL